MTSNYLSPNAFCFRCQQRARALAGRKGTSVPAALIRVIVVIVVIRVRSLMFSAGQDFVHPLSLGSLTRSASAVQRPGNNDLGEAVRLVGAE